MSTSMSSISCARCGAEMTAGARFCRRCGQPVPAPSASSVLEAETRIFETAREPATPTQHINSPLTGPAYMEPGQMPSAPSPVTTSLEPSGSTTKVLLAFLVLIALIAFVSLAAMKILSSRNSRAETPVVTVPEIPPPPPPAPPPGNSGGSSATSGSLIYPGAKTILDITKADGHVLQLRTSAPLDKVVEWYKDQIRPTETVQVPGGNMTVLRNDDIRAVITATGTETDIIIKRGGEE